MASIDSSHRASESSCHVPTVRFEHVRATALWQSAGSETEALFESRSKGRALQVQAFPDLTGITEAPWSTPQGEVIFAQGDTAKHVMHLQSGGVKLSVQSKAGRDAVLAMLGPGDFFGEGCLAGQRFRIGTATAIMPSVILPIGCDTMVRLLHEKPTILDQFIGHMLERTIRIEEDLIDHLFNSSEKRLARALLMLAEYRKQTKSATEPEDLPEDARGDGRHDTPASEFLSEQVQDARVHRLQRRAQSQPLAVDRCPADSRL